MMRLSRSVPPRVKNPEGRLLGDYLAHKFPQYVVLQKQPLGPGVAGDAISRRQVGNSLRASRPWRPEVDAVVVLAPPARVQLARNGKAGVVLSAPPGTVLLLIEAKVKEYLNGLAKLPLYKTLVATTPELAGCEGCEIRMILVVPRAAPWVETLARELGVDIDLWEPAWMAEYWTWRDSYWSKAHREERDRVKAARERLGL